MERVNDQANIKDGAKAEGLTLNQIDDLDFRPDGNSVIHESKKLTEQGTLPNVELDDSDVTMEDRFFEAGERNPRLEEHFKKAPGYQGNQVDGEDSIQELFDEMHNDSQGNQSGAEGRIQDLIDSLPNNHQGSQSGEEGRIQELFRDRDQDGNFDKGEKKLPENNCKPEYQKPQSSHGSAEGGSASGTRNDESISDNSSQESGGGSLSDEQIQQMDEHQNFNPQANPQTGKSLDKILKGVVEEKN